MPTPILHRSIKEEVLPAQAVPIKKKKKKKKTHRSRVLRGLQCPHERCRA